MTQGERIKEVRKTLGLSLEKFGEKLGVTKQTVSRIENGINNLTEQMIKSICREYRVDYDWLVYGEGDMFSNIPETILDELCLQYELDDVDRSIVDFYITLPADVRKVLKEHLKKYKK